MDSSKKADQKPRKRAPAMSPEARENQLIALAYDATEKRIRSGKASSQELVHFLRMGSSKERQEMEIQEIRRELMEAKTEAIKSQQRQEELLERAIEAFTSYRYDGGVENDDD